jgi:hypothetical protein
VIFSRNWVEQLPGHAEVDVGKDRDQTQLSQNRQQILNHTRATPNGPPKRRKHRPLCECIPQIGIEHMLEQTGKTVVVLGHNENESIGPLDRRANCESFRASPASINREPDLSDINQLSCHVLAF